MSAPTVSIGDCFEIAESMVGLDGWKGYQWQSADGGFVIKGCVPSGVYKKGKKKGTPKFRPAIPNTERTVIVSHEKCVEHVRLYESSTGNCFVCKGSGQQWAGWSRELGEIKRPCKSCSATGLAERAKGVES